MMSRHPAVFASLVIAMLLAGCTVTPPPSAVSPSINSNNAAVVEQTPATLPAIIPKNPEEVTPPQPTKSPAGIVNVQQVWDSRAAWVNQSFTIADVVSLEVRCPDVQGARPDQCTTMVWLGATGQHPFPVYQGGEWVSCKGTVSPANGCNSWRDGETYQMVATLRQKQLNSGKLLDSYYLEVTVIGQR